jgi:Na+/H+ antiporter NhaD/arsenite permease-like protein
VPFFWPAHHLLLPTLLLAASILAIFFVLDSLVFRREPVDPAREPAAREAFGIQGKASLALLLAVAASILLSGLWHAGVALRILGVALTYADLARAALLAATIAIAMRVADRAIHRANDFSWLPMIEVAKLFAAIFVTIAPAIAMLRAGPDGALAPAVALLSAPGGAARPAMYFWLTGAISSLLDSAPTYLMFFNAAGGDPARLAGPQAGILAAISAGAVFMGANSYVGNAPNFLIKSICERRGIAMPGFLAYAFWAGLLTIPLYAAETALFFR